MDAVHSEMGLGRMPKSPIVDYLARSLSLVYASMAPLCGFLARDVRRYPEIIALQATVKLVGGFGLLMLDLALGMPLFWTVCEGPLIMALSVAVLLLVRGLPLPAVKFGTLHDTLGDARTIRDRSGRR
jgi:hypothetical protein